MNVGKTIAVTNAKTVYKDGDNRIKCFSSEYSKAHVLNEALNQARLEECGLNIPKILEVTSIDGQWTIVSEFIKGNTLDQLMAENPEKKDEYLELFVNLQLNVHSKTCPQLVNLKDKLTQKILMSDLDATTRYDLHTRLENMPKHDKVCHGDFTPSNIVIAEDGTPYIIDWCHATQGNASADVARTYLLFLLEGENETAKQYLDLFCEKSGIEKEYVQRWMPLVAAAQSVVGNEKEKELLLTWVDTKKYE